jgi:uncharacterized protein
MSLKTVFEQKVADTIINLKWAILAVAVIITAAFAYGCFVLQFKVALEDMLPPANPFVKLNAEFGHRFGGLSYFCIQVSATEGDLFTPERLKTLGEITDDIYFMKEVRRDLVWSITMNKAKEIKGLTGNVFINAFMWPHPPDTVEGCKELKQKILSSALFSGRLLSTDGKNALITGNIADDVSEKAFFQGLMGIKSKFEGKEGLSIKMVGRPVLMGWIYHFMTDMIMILGISLLLILGVLRLSFRSLAGLFVPFLSGILSTIWGLGFMGLTKMNLNPLMIVLPFAVGIRAISHTVQITSRFIEEYARCENKSQAAHITAGAMFIPNVSAIAAEAAGFIFLVAVKITVVQQIAVAITFWLFSIFFTSAILTPIICVILPKPSAKVTEGIKKSWGNIAVNGKGGDKLDKIIFALTRFFMTKGRPFAIGGIAVVIITGAYLARNLHSGDLSPGSPVLYPDSEYNIASAEINERFEHAGTDVLQVYFDGKGKSGMAFAPAVLQAEQRLHKEFLTKLPDTYSGWDSVVPIVKKMNIEMHEGDVKWDFIPDDPQLLGTVLSIYLAKLLPTDFNKYVDAETHSLGNVNYFFKDHMPGTIKNAMNVTKEFFEKLDIDVSPYGEFKIAGGEIGVGSAINSEIDSVHYLIIFGVLFLIFLLCALSFKSATAGFLLIIPVVASNAVAFGYMVLKGVGMTINTLPVICVGLGIGVDFGIYLYTRFQEEYKNCNDYDLAILTGCATAGKGVVHTALTMVVPLYLWYFISSIRFQGEMGLFLAIILTVNLMAVMFFHPAIVSKLKPKFITKMTME